MSTIAVNSNITTYRIIQLPFLRLSFSKRKKTIPSINKKPSLQQPSHKKPTHQTEVDPLFTTFPKNNNGPPHVHIENPSLLRVPLQSLDHLLSHLHLGEKKIDGKRQHRYIIVVNTNMGCDIITQVYL